MFSLTLMSKGEKRSGVVQTGCYSWRSKQISAAVRGCHQCQRGRLLAGLQLGVSLSLMERTTMARTMMENRLGRHRKSRQEECTDGGQISGVRSEHGVRPSLDPGEPARSLKCKEKRAYKILKAGGPSIFGQDT
jgi:hypothetical protein